MLSGAMETLAEAGVALIGGHSIKDSEIKLGFAITGVIDPELASSLDNPQAGDTLVLTKPLGTGVLTFAEQINRGHPNGLAAAATAMATLNRGAAEAMKAAGASACTDVTGFGLFAHLVRMLRPHGLAARIQAEALPAFEGVLEALRDQIIPGAIERNREFVGVELRMESGVDEALIQLGFDAQTSGGLLMTIAPERLEPLREELARRGSHAFVIGQLTTRTDCVIRIGRSTPATSPVVEPDPLPILDNESPKMAPTESHGAGCCADVFGTAPSAGSILESQRAFGAMMRSVQGAGALDEKTKELILFSLIIHSRCAPCFTAHYERACELGISRAELDESAWCAIAMGGAPIKMFYQECLARVDAAASLTTGRE
jgi:selenide, water dikinase